MYFVSAMASVIFTIFEIDALVRPFTRYRNGPPIITVVCFVIVAAIATIVVCGDGQ